MSITLNPPPELTPGPRPKTTYTLAVCLYPQFTMLDYQGPIEILTTFPSQNRQNLGLIELLPKFPDIGIAPDYLSHTNEPVEPLMGPNVVPTGTYKQAMEEGKQYDLLLIPGGERRVFDYLIEDRCSCVSFVFRECPPWKCRSVLDGIYQESVS